VLHAARWKYRTQKNRHFGTIAQLCRAISSELRHVSTIRKNLLNSNASSTCPDNITAEICWLAWGTPANFNGFCVLAVLLHGTNSGRQPNFAALNRGCHIYSAGRPSRWALAHISSLFWHAPLGVHSAIRRHQPPQRMVLSQIDCFVQCEVVGSQVSPLCSHLTR